MEEKRDYEIIHDENEREEQEDYRPEFEWTKQERRWYALGALKGALLIGLAYLLGLGLIIFLIVTLWG